MDIIEDKVILVLRELLPQYITKANQVNQASDTARFGVPLTLVEPVDYLTGIHFSFSSLPMLLVYSNGFTSANMTQGTGAGQLNTHSIIIDYYNTADIQEGNYRMMSRMAWCLNKVCRNEKMKSLKEKTVDSKFYNYNLTKEFIVDSVNIGLVEGRNGTFYNNIRINARALITAAMLDNFTLGGI